MIKAPLPKLYASGDGSLGHPDETKKRGKCCWKGVLSITSEVWIVYNGVG